MGFFMRAEMDCSSWSVVINGGIQNEEPHLLSRRAGTPGNAGAHKLKRRKSV